MSDSPPDWAFERVASLTGHFWSGEMTRNHTVTQAFAAYIAAHEDEPPVDPLMDEVQELADALGINLSAMPWVEGALMDALRRGVELGKEQAR